MQPLQTPERVALVVEYLRNMGIKSKCLVATGQGLVIALQPLQRTREIGEIVRVPIVQFYGAADQSDRLFGSSPLKGKDTEQVDCVRVVRVSCQNAPVTGLCLC